MSVLPPPARWNAEVETLVIGAGACGLTAALSAADAGADVLVLERDDSPYGSTSMSSGFIPAPGTRAQRALGIEDAPEILARDIRNKAGGSAVAALVETATRRIGPTLDWLEARHGLEWLVLDDFLYPGHSRHRMHAVPEKTGEALMARLLAAAGAAGVPILTGAQAAALHVEQGRVVGARIRRPDGAEESVGARAVVLASSGFGGDRERVAREIPPMAAAPYHGHASNRGDALRWGEALGAEARCLSACQGHGSLAHPHGVLITWALMTEGGVQVNAEGRRFHDEHQGYSEAALPVLSQPGGVAWDVFDARLLAFARGFPDFREAERAGAVRTGNDARALAEAWGLPPDALSETIAHVRACAAGDASDPFGRSFTTKPALKPPYAAVKVTGALFHTQGGLMIDDAARVLRPDGSAVPGLFAGGGAACGVSGTGIAGYLSGNGLLTAVAFGALAGESAARPAPDAHEPAGDRASQATGSRPGGPEARTPDER